MQDVLVLRVTSLVVVGKQSVLYPALVRILMVQASVSPQGSETAPGPQCCRPFKAYVVATWGTKSQKNGGGEEIASPELESDLQLQLHALSTQCLFSIFINFD